MANPLAGSGGSGFEPPAIGEGRTYTGTSAKGHSKTMTVVRTDRPYAEDLADAANATLSEDARKLGLMWQVTATGELKLDFTPRSIAENTDRIMRQRNDERREFIRRLDSPVV